MHNACQDACCKAVVAAHLMPCHAMSCFVFVLLSCNAMACHVLCRVLSCLVMTCHAMYFFFVAGRYDEMSTVLRRITNAPVHLPPEMLAEQRAVRRNGPSFSTRWQSWRNSLGGGVYHSVPAGRVVDPKEEEGFSDRYGNKRHVCAGVRQVLCPGSDARLRRSTIVLVVVWFTLSYGSYGVATWNNQLFADVGLSNPYLCSFIYSLSNLPGNVGSIILVERVSGAESRIVHKTAGVGCVVCAVFGLVGSFRTCPFASTLFLWSVVSASLLICGREVCIYIYMTSWGVCLDVMEATCAKTQKMVQKTIKAPNEQRLLSLAATTHS